MTAIEWHFLWYCILCCYKLFFKTFESVDGNQLGIFETQVP